MSSRAISTAALVISVLALCMGGAAASGLITSKDIQNGAIHTPDLHKNAVLSKDLMNGAVRTADIGEGQVQPSDIELPPPVELKAPGVFYAEPPTMDFLTLAQVGAYEKKDPTSFLRVDWTGSVEGHNGGEASGCVFQLRVDGQPAGAGTGEVFAQGLTSVSDSAIFGSLPPGPHKVEIWARLAAIDQHGSALDSCTVGPQEAGGVAQTVDVSEEVR
jgi:hypothetical protein